MNINTSTVRYMDDCNVRCDVMLVEELEEVRRDYPNNTHDKFDITFVTDENMGDLVIPKSAEFEGFYRAATQHLKGCRGVAYMTDNGYKCVVVVYMPDDVIEVGKVEVEVYNAEAPTYHVRSHNIKNMRFCPYRSPEEYRTKSSTKLNKAITNARQHLKPNRLADVVRVSYETARAVHRSVREKANTATVKAAHALEVEYYPDIATLKSGIPELLRESMQLVEMGLVKFSDSLSDKMVAFQTALTAYEEAYRDKPTKVCWVHPDHRNDMVTDMHAFNMSGGLAKGDLQEQGLCPTGKNFMSQGQRSVRTNEVSEDVQHKVAALSMCENGEFVEDVGFKFNNSVYYVYTEE